MSLHNPKIPLGIWTTSVHVLRLRTSCCVRCSVDTVDKHRWISIIGTSAVPTVRVWSGRVAGRGLPTSAGYTGERNPADRSQWGPVNFAHKSKAYVRCLKTQIFALTICKRGQGTCSRDRTGQNCRWCSIFRHPNLTTLPSCVAGLGQC